MATYRITTKTGESYKIESPNELSNEELAGYAENPLGEQSQPEPVNPTVPEPTKPTFSQIQEDQKGKDVADLKGLYDRSVERGSSVYQPTTIGEALKQKPGTIGEAIVGTPERALRLGSATVGTAADAVNTGLKIATRGLIGEKPGEAAASAIKKTGLPELVAPAIKKYQEFKSNLDPASRANVGAAESGLSALGTFGGIKTGEGVAKRLVGEGSVLKESGANGVVKALVDPLKNEAGAISPNKPYTIPDIDDIADVEEAAKSVVDLPKNMGEIKKNIGQPPKKGIRNYALSTEEQEFLSKPEALTETPFPVVMQQAQLAKQKRFEGVLTPLDKAAADKGGEALRLISSKKSEIGKIKGDLVDAADDYLIATNQFADATPIQQRFVELVRDRLGAQFDEKGRLVDAAGRIMNDSAEKGLIIKMARTINKLRPETTLKELDDVVMDLRNMVEHKKSSQTKQIFTKADGIGETVRGDIKNLIDDYLENSVNWGGADDFLGKEGVATLKGSLRDYANIAKIEDRLNRGLGEVVDPVTGQAKMGASLLKSSLMSNSDRGTKALFRAVNDLTGIDLMKEAAKAEIAMKAVGDDRINDLLKEAGAIRSLAQGDKAGALLKLGEKAAQKWTGEKPDQLLRYYYKYNPEVKPKNTPEAQKQKPPTIGEALKRTLGNERGAVGGDNPQIHTENFKNWFGDWKNKPEQASKVVGKDGAPIVMHHGTLGKFNEFDEGARGSNTGAKGAERGFFFARNRADADFYKTKAEQKHYEETGEEIKGDIKKVFLDIKKPLVLDDAKNSTVEKDILDKIIDDDAAALDYAKDNGFDGVIWPHGNMNNSDYTAVVFEPNQIKSATGNSGAFSKSTNDIRGSSALKAKPETIGSILKNERGSVGSENPQIHTDNFKNWFGDWKNKPEQASKVVDDKGNPLVVYHGGSGDFNSFENGASRGYGLAFFTESPETASKHAIGGGVLMDKSVDDYIDMANSRAESGNKLFIDRKSNVKPVYLDIKNPLTEKSIDLKKIFNGDKDDAIEKFNDFYPDSDGYFEEIKDREDFWDVLKNEIDGSGFIGEETEALSKSPKITTILTMATRDKDLWDRIHNIYDGRVYFDAETGNTTFVPNYPNQIKSAIGNSGAFSKSTNDIRGSSALKTMAATGATAAGALTIGEAIKAKNKK